MYTAQDVRKLPSGPKAFNHQHSFNPNSTRQGQNWPRRHWCQITNKILMYRILENTYFCLNIFRIFFNFRQGVKKFHFDINFEKFMSKAQSWHNHTVPPPLPLGYTAISDHLNAGEVPMSMVRGPVHASQHQVSYQSQALHIERGRVFSWVCSLVLSK